MKSTLDSAPHGGSPKVTDRILIDSKSMRIIFVRRWMFRIHTKVIPAKVRAKSVYALRPKHKEGFGQ
jgi:hypothetical protein